MAVRRKSNWYIYFIAFGISLAFVLMVIFTFRWFLFPERSEPAGLTSSGELTEDFQPTEEHNFTLLTMLSDGAGELPTLYIVVAYNAVDSRLTFMPLPAGVSVTSEGRDLRNIYEAQGGEGVIKAIESSCQVKCDKYVKFDRDSFIDLVSAFGNVQYEVKNTLLIPDGTEVETLNAGSQLFSPQTIFRYVMLADFGEGESHRYNMVCDLLSALVNQNSSYIDSSLLDTYASMLLEQDTNLTEEDYTARKAALLNTVIYAVNPAEYYIPYGEFTDDGAFNIAENSVISMQQKTGQDGI